MKWYRHLYWGKNAHKKRYKLLWKLRHHRIQSDVYLLVLPSNPDNNLDILNANYFLQKHYRRQKLLVVGIAISYEEAQELLLKLVEDIYQKTGQAHIREYLTAQSGL